MYHLPSSCLVLFFLFSLLHLLPYASSTQEGWCESKFQCGSITAGFPFSGGNRSPVCGHPLLQLNCYKDVTSIIISDHLYNVFHINQTSHTLKLARAELQGSFCNSTFTATPTFPSDIFELSPTYKSLTVFFLCDPKLSYRSSYTCPDRGPVTISQNLDYHFGSCKDSFTINVPKSFVPEEKELNLAKLENALREGFELKVKIDEKACQECLSSHGSCSFENTTQVCCKGTSSSRICSSLHQPNATELHTLCSIPFSCGDQTGLSYPFWIYGREDCGHPDFGLNCSGEHAELSISSVKYRILSTNYTSGIIRLTRLDSINDPCPQDPINMSFEENVLPLAQTSDLLTIYYDCNEITESFPTLPTYIKNLDCRNDKTEDDRRDYYVTRSLSSPLPDYSAFLNHFRSFCSKTVSTPASRITLNTLESAASTDNLKKALNESFELGVNKDCKMCMGSGGACGYNQTHTATNGFVCYCIDETTNLVCKRTNKGVSNGGLSAAGKAGIGIASGLGILFITGIGFAFGLGILFITGALLLLIRRRRKTESGQYEKQQNLEALVSLKRYSYTQVKRITNSFAEVIGKGGFGTVYRGTLCDGRSVAVKILKDSKGNGEDFINEVASMSKTSHVNIVDLLGFCSEGSKRAILYEFMENGSLDRLISKKTLEWTKLYSIALGIARGLEYLHHGCKEKIVHFDIKPQNILLDADLCPKVSDFGLAKLCKKKESILSLLDTRGTIGYIAPEVFSKMYGRVSHKSDVYSYGMLVLEMIGARNKERAAQNAGSDTSSMYFPEWIYKDLEKGHNMDGIACEEDEILKKMTLVGLWCIQSSPSDRPPMNRVVEMMESSVDSIETPPRPCVQVPSASFQLSSTLPEDISISSENSRC